MLVTQIKYSLVLGVQLSLLLVDLGINAFGDRLRYNSGLLLLLFIIQDSLQVLSLTILFITIFQTNVFQAGFISLLYDKFQYPVLVAMAYLLLTIALQSWMLSVRWDEPLKYNWPTFMGLLYTIQRSIQNMFQCLAFTTISTRDQFYA
ncbi:transmembrane protein 138-like isoform X2 [Macrosteles quadrilineatus]|uniref:transmembrane protein 138-like isoform X2 n=1 Tax=Macrosteles quadrilineatus TaxID=74068 RepID=UPI0023E2E774|nr:transmembrane protein 138-like isoform X2 [Macrosteles quadrilineatus]